MQPRPDHRLPQSVVQREKAGDLGSKSASRRTPALIRRNLRGWFARTTVSLVATASLPLLGPPSAAQETAPLPPPAAVSPEELLRSLARCAKPDWASKFRSPASVSLQSRAQIALVLGGVFADGYLAAQAEDAQQCKNIGKDLFRLSKTLGVQSELLDRSRSIADSAQKKEWSVLRRELNATEAELGAALRKHEDEALARLVSLGAWVRSTEIVASLLSDQYSENAAALLRQPALGVLLGSSLEKLGEKLETDPAIEQIRPKLGTVERLLNASADTPPSAGEVKEIALVLSAIVKDVNEKKR
jgi:hypothetical protein